MLVIKVCLDSVSSNGYPWTMNDEDLNRLKEKLYGDSSQLHRYRSPDSLRSVMDLSQFVGDMMPCRQRNIETQALLYAAIEQWYFCRGAVTTFRRLARRARAIYRLRGESIRQARRSGSPVTLPEQTPMSDGLSESFHPVRREWILGTCLTQDGKR